MIRKAGKWLVVTKESVDGMQSGCVLSPWSTQSCPEFQKNDVNDALILL